MPFTTSDLAALGTPEIIEQIDYESVRTGRLQKFLSFCTAKGIPYDVDGLESDPAVVLLEEASYEETVLRARGNDIALQHYLYYASGSSLDHMAAFYDVIRLTGEDDDRLKARVILAIQGRSTGGTAPRYKAVAMGASLRVADAFVYVVPPSPVVNIAVFATDNNGVADQALLDTVRAAVNADAVRMVNDTLSVRSAVVQVVNVAADIWLLPDASTEVLATIVSTLPRTWIAESGLGRDLLLDWLRARMMISGVYKVAITAPLADVPMEPFQAARIGTVTLNFRGRAY